MVIPVYNIQARDRGYLNLIADLRNLGIVIDEFSSSFIMIVKRLPDDDTWNGDESEFHPRGGLKKNYEYKVKKK